MRGLPGWRPMTACGIVLAVMGLVLVALSVGLAMVYAATSSGSALGWALMAGMGYGFQFAVLGSCLALLSLVSHWFVQGFRTCPVWHSER